MTARTEVEKSEAVSATVMPIGDDACSQDEKDIFWMGKEKRGRIRHGQPMSDDACSQDETDMSRMGKKARTHA